MGQKIYIIGNWKMNKTYAEVCTFFRAFDSDWPFNSMQLPNIEVLIAPSTIHLSNVNSLLPNLEQSSFNGLVAQNVAAKENGAFTGENSASMLVDYVTHVIIGHSERRKYFSENNEVLLEKLRICHKYKLTPIFCFGETAEQRSKGEYLSIIKDQLNQTLMLMDSHQISKTILAYEPIWAIGSGQNADSMQIQEVHDYVRSLIVQQIGQKDATDVPILYGGSCTSQNTQSILSNLNVNGLLIGGASLDSSQFLKIIQQADELSRGSF